MRKILFLIINIVICILSIAWLAINPGFDSAIAALTAIGLLVTYKLDNNGGTPMLNKKMIIFSIIALVIFSICIILAFQNKSVITGIHGDGNHDNNILIK